MVGCGLASRRVTYRTQWFPLLEEHRRREVDFVLQVPAHSRPPSRKQSMPRRGSWDTRESIPGYGEQYAWDSGAHARKGGIRRAQGLPRDLSPNIGPNAPLAFLHDSPAGIGKGRIKLHHIF